MARDAMMRWKDGGKVRSGMLFDDMKTARKNFVNALNYCKKHKNDIAKRIIAEKYKSKNGKEFWKEVRKRKPDNKSKVNEIDGLRDSQAIVSYCFMIASVR